MTHALLRVEQGREGMHVSVVETVKPEESPTLPPSAQDEEAILEHLTLDELIAKILGEHELEDQNSGDTQ